MDAFTYAFFSGEKFDEQLSVVRIAGNQIEIIDANRGDFIASSDIREIGFEIEESNVLIAFSRHDSAKKLFRLETPHFRELYDYGEGKQVKILFEVELAGQTCYVEVSSEQLLFYRQNEPFYTVELTGLETVIRADFGLRFVAEDGEIELAIDPIVREGLHAVIQHTVSEKAQRERGIYIDETLQAELARIDETAARHEREAKASLSEDSGTTNDQINLFNTENENRDKILNVQDRSTDKKPGEDQSRRSEVRDAVVSGDDQERQCRTATLHTALSACQSTRADDNSRYHTSQLYNLYLTYLKIENQIFTFEAPQFEFEMQVRLLDNVIEILSYFNEQFQTYVYVSSSLIRPQTIFTKAVFQIAPVPFELRGDQDSFLSINVFLEQCSAALAAGHDVSGCFEYYTSEPNVLARLKAAIDVSEREHFGAFYGVIGGRKLTFASDEILDIDNTALNTKRANTQFYRSTQSEVEKSAVVEDVSYEKSPLLGQDNQEPLTYGQIEEHKPFLACRAPGIPSGEPEFEGASEDSTNLRKQVEIVKEVYEVSASDGGQYKMQIGYAKGAIVVKLQRLGQKMCKYRLDNAKALGDTLLLWHSGRASDDHPFSVQGGLTELGSALEAVIGAFRTGVDLGVYFD